MPELTQVVLTRIDGIREGLDTVRGELHNMDERQRRLAEAVARLEAKLEDKPIAAPPAESAVVPSKAQAAATGGLVAVMLALVEVIRMIAVSGE